MLTRINHFHAKDGEGTTLRALIESFLPAIADSKGCHSCQLLQQMDDEDQLVVIEIWDNVEAHQASLKNVAPEVFQQAMALLAERPSGAYYSP